MEQPLTGKKIPMPPPGVDGLCRDCMGYGDELSIHFDLPGYFAPSVQGLFTPDLPNQPGKLYAAGEEIGPFTPVTTLTTEVVLGFFSQQTQTLWLDTLTITDKCP